MVTIYCARVANPALKGFVRDLRPIWVLEELGVPYEKRYLDANRREQKKPEYLAIHPLGKIPAMDDDGLKIFESGAICSYLSAKYGEGKMVPARGTREWAEHEQWCYYATASVEAFTARIFVQKVFGSDADVARVIEDVKSALELHLGFLDRRFGERRFVMGESFQTADILLSTAARYAALPQIIGDYPHLNRYLEEVASRPAHQAAFIANTGY